MTLAYVRTQAKLCGDTLPQARPHLFQKATPFHSSPPYHLMGLITLIRTSTL